MDGRAIYVRSEQEQKICFVLSSLGVRFRYEEAYEHQLADEMHSQYRPDFSIYFEQNGVTKRIYLEHFGVDEHGLVPAWFAKDKNKNNNAKKEKRTSNMPSNDKLEDHVLYFESGMSVMEVANGLGVSVTELVKKLFVSMGMNC